MHSSARYKRPDQRLFRIEKRLPALIPVYLTSMEDRHARERTLTENVSPHGARVMSKRSWRPGEDSLITLSAEGFAQVAKVIYCLPRAGYQFCLGIEFPGRAVKWSELSSA